jgi:Chaperone of endosialidase
MALQNFVDGVGPAISSAFLNNVDAMVNTALGGTPTLAAVQAVLGIGGSSVSSLAGTANQITASASTGVVTLSVPPVFVVPGSLASTTNCAVGTSLTVGSTAVITGGATAASFTVSSDRRLKKKIRKIGNAAGILRRLEGVRFTWQKSNEPSVGLIAQNVEKVLPELVSINPETGFKGVNYDGIIGVLVEEVKALRAELNALKGR